MIYIFITKGKAREVFEALREAVLLEVMFGRIVEQLEARNFSAN